MDIEAQQMPAVDPTMEMDIDMDIDLDLPQEQIDDFVPNNNVHPFDSVVATDGDQMASDPAPEKVHIRGLDTFATGNIKDYVAEHDCSDQFVKIEWVDDTSANLIYENADAARSVLDKLTAEGVGPTMVEQLRPAKRLSTHPDIELQVRQATLVDVKKPRAADASRFYLMNPDKDPREVRRRRLEAARKGGRSVDGGNDTGDYRRRRFDDREHRRRRNADHISGFSESMYDEDGDAATDTALGRRITRQGSTESSGSEYRRSRGGRRGRGRFAAEDDLFAAKMRRGDGRLRDRSASPLPDGGDGRLGFAEDDAGRRRRSASPSYAGGANRGKELFPSTKPSGAGVLSSSSTSNLNSAKELFPPAPAPKELFPSSLSSAKQLSPTNGRKRSRELFPHKTAISNHRRTAAFDAAVMDDTADASGIMGNKRPRSRGTPSLALEDRITGGPLPKAAASPHRAGGARSNLNRTRADSAGAADGASGFSIRGQADRGGEQLDEGFSIRGAAASTGGAGQGQAAGAKVKELFPLKTGGGNAGKELFSEKIKGRGGPRRKAEDMFF
ncbi:hypothetical protein BDY21DRAFT_89461 [Lineolata rhizophorae]|uniref:Uncharacterized protein n=1 Tax=Lineolata rhizophorae TaxID=578093 RepID=A0A6A6PCR7_9PEZI|nr:hypothetical protein BDY21DRAFT_89461 [Lineolata rhizophorae]